MGDGALCYGALEIVALLLLLLLSLTRSATAISSKVLWPTRYASARVQ